MERFKLYRFDDKTYVCKDDACGIVCTFEKHKFNETQEFKIEGKMADVTMIARSTREMSDWIANNFYNIAMPVNHRVRIGQEIKALRMVSSLSQAELGERADLEQSHIARIETGRYSAGIDTLQAIAETMGYQLSFCPIEDDDVAIGFEVPISISEVKS